MPHIAQPAPLGVSLVEGGINVAVMSRHAQRVFVCLFDERGDIEECRIALPLRLGDIHYGFIADVKAGCRYGLRAEGEWNEAEGHRFDGTKLLVDPYATALDRPFAHHPALAQRGVDTVALVPKGIVTAPLPVVQPLPPRRPGFIYELQVKSFTALHPDIPADIRGTVAALAEPVIINHLKNLGVDTVELMPLMAWIDERHLSALSLSNGWGYNPVSFFAPDPRLAPGGFAEIRHAVAALHEAGIRVILDVVFNHSGESDTEGATLSLRGLDNVLYYRHAQGRLINDTGCGNTLALDRAPVMRLAMDAMRHWVNATGLDGFRFDLAPVMGRLETGYSVDAPLLSAIEQDPLLSSLIMIAEPWDIGPGGYQLGHFPKRWLEWNDRYRDDVRTFWRGDHGSVGALATRLTGSADCFDPSRRPSSSVNFIAAHDGFTLRDTVTFAHKFNQANGEDNRDGSSHEPTWPGGDVRALLATLFFSHGTLMLTAGDEFGRTQRGNNNAYAQDNALTWLDWRGADTALMAEVATLARLRADHPIVTEDRFLTGLINPETGFADAEWFGGDGEPMAWHDPSARILGLILSNATSRMAILINGGEGRERALLPARSGYQWSRLYVSAPGDGVPARSVSLYQEIRVKSSGISDALLNQLADAAQIERDWWEVDGTHHRVTPDSLRAILTSLTIAHATSEEAEEALRHMRQRQAPLIGRWDTPLILGPASDTRRRFHLTNEEGQIKVLDVPPGVVPVAQLDEGYFDLLLEGASAAPRRVIISPGACYLPERLTKGERVHGLASHLYALRHAGDGGIGDFETLRRFADVTAMSGGSLAGINPLHHLFPNDRERASPYQPSDRRFVDPIYINIAALLAKGRFANARPLAERHAAAFARLEALSTVDYTAVWQAKSAILNAAFAEFGTDPAFEAFSHAGGEELQRHAAYETRLAGEPPDPIRHRYRAFLQWVADDQLAAASSRHNLYRDLALGCAFDGGEMAEAPQHFAPGVSIGAPPDPFSRQGQVWNLPPFSPLALMDAGYAPMRTILAANMRHAAALRIDHVLGFMRQFFVPQGAEGRAGAYVRFPLNALIAITAIESQRQSCLIIGEDLGTTPDGLRAELSAANILSYRVLWFEREGLQFKPASAYPVRALSCLASHDLPTFMGWREGRDITIEAELGLIKADEVRARQGQRADEIEALNAATGCLTNNTEDETVAAHGFVAKTPSLVMLTQVDDLIGAKEPLNVPGTDRERPNWRRRLSIPIDHVTEQPLASAILNRVRTERPS